MNKEEFIGKLEMVYVGDKRASKDIILEYDRLNNIINELEKWLEDNLGNCRTNQNYTSNQIYNLKEDIYYRCLDKLKTLKENNKDV